jgi:hypothetical protein
MADQKHKYTVTTPHGDVNLSTDSHHSAFADIEAFLKAHQPTVASALGLSTLAVSALGLYLNHGRSGPKLR